MEDYKIDIGRHHPKKGNRKRIYGKGVLDIEFSCKIDSITAKAYKIYGAVLCRCYGKKQKTDNPSYEGCYVSEEWLSFGNFLEWFKNNYIEGYCIDKDILCKGNKCYCPQFCCFVPRAINSLITNRRNYRGNSVIGSYKTESGKYKVHCNKYGKPYDLGLYDTEIEAFDAYKTEKEKYIKEIAEEYYNEGKITEKVYNALLNYKVEITD